MGVDTDLPADVAWRELDHTIRHRLVEADAEFTDRAAVTGNVRVVEDVWRVMAECQPRPGGRLQNGALPALDFRNGIERNGERPDPVALQIRVPHIDHRRSAIQFNAGVG